MRGYQNTERPFNQAQLLMERLDQRLNDLDISYIERDLSKWYRTARSVYTNSQFKFEEEERTKIENLLSVLATALRTASKQSNEVLFFQLEKNINKVWIELINLLYKYQILYPHYESKTWQQIAMEEDI